MHRKLYVPDLSEKEVDRVFASMPDDRVCDYWSRQREIVNGFVYVIACETSSAMKFGYAINPKRRLDDLQLGNPFKLSLVTVAPGSIAVEKGIHSDLRFEIVGREWFDGELSYEYAERIAAFSRVAASEFSRTKQAIKLESRKPPNMHRASRRPGVVGVVR